jgi:hypothetical protein
MLLGLTKKLWAVTAGQLNIANCCTFAVLQSLADIQVHCSAVIGSSSVTLMAPVNYISNHCCFYVPNSFQ